MINKINSDYTSCAGAVRVIPQHVTKKKFNKSEQHPLNENIKLNEYYGVGGAQGGVSIVGVSLNELRTANNNDLHS